MISLKSTREIDDMAAAGAVLAGMHLGLRDIVKPGISSWKIEEFAREYFKDRGAIAAQIGFEGYKYATCVSINDEICHGFPRKQVTLKNGDLVKIDTVVEYNGAFSDSCWSYAVGEVTPAIAQLMDVTKQSLYLGIDQAVVGNRLGDIGATIQHFTEDEHGYGDVRDFVGHGIGPTMHEDPMVPHYGVAGKGQRLRNGMTITIEPMINTGTWEANTDHPDGWTATTMDGGWSCQYEHTLAITNDGPKILTSQDPAADAKYLWPGYADQLAEHAAAAKRIAQKY